MRLRIIINSYANNRAKIISNSVINSTVANYLDNLDVTYSDIVKINNNENGSVKSVEFDTITITKIKSKLISEIQENISKHENLVLSVPIGTLTGSRLLNNRGPNINMGFKISSAVYTDIKSQFISAGINQTLHKITLKVCSEIYFVMPWYRTNGNFETEYTIAETVIVGEVPDAYTNVIEYPGSDMAGYLFDYSAEN